MRILFYGPFRDGSGYSVAARGYLKALDSLIEKGEDIDLRLLTLDLEHKNSHLTKEDRELIEKYEFKFDKRTGKTSEDEVNKWLENPEPYVFMWDQPTPMITWERFEGYESSDFEKKFWNSMRKLLNNAKYNINFTVWEADRVHPGWIDTMKLYNVDAVVVPSQYNYETFKTDLPANIKTFYIPHPVELKELGESEAFKLPTTLDDKFVIFSMSQWGIRKGFDKLLLAYYLEFGHQQDVVLVLKTNGSIMNAEDLQKQTNNIIGDAKQYKQMVFMDGFMEKPTCQVALLTNFLPNKNIQWLYEQADVFALPSRAEGFGLTMAEAIVKKLPVITTRATGHAEFISKYHPFIVNGSYEPYMAKVEFTQYMNWFEPSVNSIRLNLRATYNLWKFRGGLLEKYADEQLAYFNEQNYTVDRVANDLKAMLKEVMNA